VIKLHKYGDHVTLFTLADAVQCCVKLCSALIEGQQLYHQLLAQHPLPQQPLPQQPSFLLAIKKSVTH